MKDFFQLREAVKSADKKPENYTDPVTGKTKTRMVPVDKEVVKTEAKDPREYDYEGDMAKTQLKTMIDAAKELHDMMGDDDNLPEWVQSKITKAVDYIDSVRDYMKSESDDEDEDEDDEDEEMNETKAAPKGFHFTKDGKLKRGDADQDGPSGRMLRADPLDKQRSKVPPVSEKTLTPAEKKKREEIAKAMERENPGMPMAKKMAIATATAKRIAEVNTSGWSFNVTTRKHGKHEVKVSRSAAKSREDAEQYIKNHPMYKKYKPSKIELNEVSTEKLRDYASAALQDKNKAKADKRWKYAGKAMQTVTDREVKAAHDRKYNKMEAAPKIKPDFVKTQREKDREHDAAMSRTPTGRKKTMTSTQRSLASMRKESTQIAEISDKMKDRYIQKAMGDHQHANAVRKDAEATGKTDLVAKMRARMKKRNQGMSRAFGGERD